jgi:magnesium transporter
MFATNLLGMDALLPPVVRFHDVPAEASASRLHYAPALSLSQQVTAQQAIEALRDMQPDTDIYYLFVTDANERLVGVISLRQLLCAEPGARLFEFMDRRTLTLPHDATLQQQAQLMTESGLLAMPVVDEKHHLVGAMDATDLIQAIQDEATGEACQLAGMRPNELTHTSPWNIGYRAGWLLSHLTVALLLAWLIVSFQDVLGGALFLLAFVPLLLRLGGQASQQTLTHLVRGLALGQVQRSKMNRFWQHELLTSMLNGLLLSGAAGTLVWLALGSAAGGLVVGGALLATMLLAPLIGGLVPLVSKALRVHPARWSALLTVAISDLVGVGLLLALGNAVLNLGYL